MACRHDGDRNQDARQIPNGFSAHITAVSKRPATNAVVDVANAPVWEDKAVLEFFETSGRNLLAAEPVAKPINGTVDGAGPEELPLDELARRFVRITKDPRSVVPDVHARYFGISLNDRSLTPGKTPRLI
jgi:hypothetical protein